MATLFSLITCLDYLERAYVRGAVHEEAYATQCSRLLGQYKTVIKLITDPSQPPAYRFHDVHAFMQHPPDTISRKYLVTLEPATRIELALSAWEADVLPLNYARDLNCLRSTPWGRLAGP